MKTKRFIKSINCSLWLGIYSILLCTTLSAQNIGINTTGAVPNVKSILDIDVSASATKMGLLVPRMTTAERNSISSPIPESLLIYNTTIQCFEAWNQVAGVWVAFGCIGCTLPNTPIANAATSASLTSFTANWSSVLGTTGYLLDVSASATFTNFVSGYNGLNVGNVLNTTVSGLNCGITYYYRVRATNACGTSISSNTISCISLACPCSAQIWAVTNLDVGTMLLPTVAQTNNSIIEKHCYNNLPANCTSYGGLYQWDEMMNYTSTINCDPCGVSGRQGICPTGYHVPTDLEWSRYEYCLESTLAPTGPVSLNDFQTLIGYRGTTTGDKLKASVSNIPAWDGNNISGFTALPSGYFDPVAQLFNNLNMFGSYWSATQNGANAAYYRFMASSVGQTGRSNSNKYLGFSVRCLMN